MVRSPAFVIFLTKPRFVISGGGNDPRSEKNRGFSSNYNEKEIPRGTYDTYQEHPDRQRVIILGLENSLNKDRKKNIKGD